MSEDHSNFVLVNILEKVKEAEQSAMEYSKLPISEELTIFKSIQELNWAWVYLSL